MANMANMANVANVAYMADMSNIFELWFAFTIRPHPSPTAPPSPLKGKALYRPLSFLLSISDISISMNVDIQKLVALF